MPGSALHETLKAIPEFGVFLWREALPVAVVTQHPVRRGQLVVGFFLYAGSH